MTDKPDIHYSDNHMRIYTRTGDQGETYLFVGGKVPKSNARIEAYGNVDELNSWLGLVLSKLKESDLRDMIARIQGDLFELGADLSSMEIDNADKKKKTVYRIRDTHTTQLEKWIDQLEKDLPPLKNFVLPNGTETAGRIHVARCVCRRAERSVVVLMSLETINREGLKYLNRLSDLLFVMSRTVNKREGCPEVPWIPPEPPVLT